MAEPHPTRREALRITALVGASAALGGTLGVGLVRELGLHRVRETRTRLGTVVTLTVVHPEAGEAAAMVERGFAEMGRLEALLSRHRPDTPVGRLNATGRGVAPPAELLHVLAMAAAVSHRSEGAFDVTVAPLLTLFERTFEATGRPPDDASIARARALVDYRLLRVEEGLVSFQKPGMSLTLDGIAKGYVVDRTVAVLAAAGAERVLVDAGGDMATSGHRRGAAPWTIGIQDPHRGDEVVGLLRLEGDCIATSGDYMSSFTQDRRWHHIIDPRAGRSPAAVSSVSVVAPTAMEADALSTAVLVLGSEAGLEFLGATPGVEGLVVDKAGARFATKGLAGRRV